MNIIINDINRVEKDWGYELIIVNNELYCGKILHFNKNSEFSMHFHKIKDETWYVTSGSLVCKIINTDNGKIDYFELFKGDSIRLKPLTIHQLIALEESEIFEISTQHFDSDSYRVWSGGSKK